MEPLSDKPRFIVGDIVRVRSSHIKQYGIPQCDPYEEFGNGPFRVAYVHNNNMHDNFDLQVIQTGEIYERLGEIAFERDDFLTAIHRRKTQRKEKQVTP